MLIAIALSDAALGPRGMVLMGLALAVALAFEFVNGFHDTANAVATVIYTKSLPPRVAVAWSGLCNFAGSLLGAKLIGLAVAYSVVHLLPVDLLIDIGSGQALAMVLALLLAAIGWNLGTWYLGIPASSTHTLVGAILGVGLANSALQGRFGRGVDWSKAGEVGLSLLISPVIGLVLSALVLVVLRRLVSDPALYRAPDGDRPPPWWVRATLIGTCSGVSLAHGANDGQKGVGLIMLILIGMMPARYALNADYGPKEIARVVAAADELAGVVEASGDVTGRDGLARALRDLRRTLDGEGRLARLTNAERWRVRTEILEVDARLKQLEATHALHLSGRGRRLVDELRHTLRGATEYAPAWVLVMVATALGVGTMIGWQRIVVTVGEKIGKDHLTYAQGASAELVTMVTIGLAVGAGLPVSTTHVLSSGVAGTMAASGSGVQMRTVRNIALAWVLTLPASLSMAAALYLLLRRVM